jgi:hypothetical protein
MTTTACKTLAVAVALIVLTAGCRSLTGRSAGEFIDNKTTVASVKTKLAAERWHYLTWVDVDANQGTVYLTGNAASEADKARATEVARRANRVERVVNNLVVNDAGQPAASPATVGEGAMTGEVMNVDRTSGQVTLRMADGNTAELRLPPTALRDVNPGDRLSVSVHPSTR